MKVVLDTNLLISTLIYQGLPAQLLLVLKQYQGIPILAARQALESELCAATGGVTCVSGVSLFLGNDQPTAQDVARHAAYVADLVGVEHTGIGLDICFAQGGLDDTPPGDYDPGYWWPAKFTGYERGLARTTFTPVETWRLLAGALQAVGMTPGEAAQVMGANMVRVASQTWHPAAE